MKDTYTLDYECPNCGHRFSLTFKRGEPADKAQECPNCGVAASRKASGLQPTKLPGVDVAYPWPSVTVPAPWRTVPSNPWWKEHPTYEPYRGPWSNPYPGLPPVWC